MKQHAQFLFGAWFTGWVEFIEQTYHELEPQIRRKAKKSPELLDDIKQKTLNDSRMCKLMAENKTTPEQICSVVDFLISF